MGLNQWPAAHVGCSALPLTWGCPILFSALEASSPGLVMAHLAFYLPGSSWQDQGSHRTHAPPWLSLSPSHSARDRGCSSPKTRFLDLQTMTYFEEHPNPFPWSRVSAALPEPGSAHAGQFPALQPSGFSGLKGCQHNWLFPLGFCTFPSYSARIPPFFSEQPILTPLLAKALPWCTFVLHLLACLLCTT